MEVRGGSRDGAVHRTLDDQDAPDVIQIENVSVSPLTSSHTNHKKNVSDVSPLTSRDGPHKRSLSEAHHLLPKSPTNLFEYSTTRELRYDRPEEPRQNSQISPKWEGIPRTLRKSRKQLWKDFTIDVLAISAGLPFFALGGALIRFNGKMVRPHQENILNQCIKGVRLKI